MTTQADRQAEMLASELPYLVALLDSHLAFESPEEFERANPGAGHVPLDLLESYFRVQAQRARRCFAPTSAVPSMLDAAAECIARYKDLELARDMVREHVVEGGV